MGRGVSSVGSSLDEGVISFCRVSLYLTDDEKDGCNKCFAYIFYSMRLTKLHLIQFDVACGKHRSSNAQVDCSANNMHLLLHYTPLCTASCMDYLISLPFIYFLTVYTYLLSLHT